MTREHSHWAGTKSVTWDKASISSFDAVVIATALEAINHAYLASWAKAVVDTRNAMKGVTVKPGAVVEGIGDAIQRSDNQEPTDR